jgi:uncharacterized YccA/Bax inhibitor family protein
MKAFGNPILQHYDEKPEELRVISEGTATYGGITFKVVILLLIGGLMSLIPIFLPAESSLLYPLLILATVGSLAFGLVGAFFPKATKVCSFGYAASYGILLGSIVPVLNAVVPGIGTIAALGTTAIFVGMLVLYQAGVVKITNTFFKVMSFLLMIIIVLGIISLIFYLVNGIDSNYLWLVVLIAGVSVIYGAISLTVDFNLCQSYVDSGATKDFEWRAAFSLLVSIIYIYIQILRLVLYLAMIFGKNR